MLQNAYLLAKVGANTAENERNFAEILSKIGNYPTGPADHRGLRPANFWQIFARFRLYRHRSLQVNTRFEAFFKIYQILKLKFLKVQSWQNFANFATFAKFCLIFTKIIAEFSNRFFAKILRLQRCKSMQIW